MPDTKIVAMALPRHVADVVENLAGKVGQTASNFLADHIEAAFSHRSKPSETIVYRVEKPADPTRKDRKRRRRTRKRAAIREAAALAARHPFQTEQTHA